MRNDVSVFGSAIICSSNWITGLTSRSLSTAFFLWAPWRRQRVNIWENSVCVHLSKSQWSQDDEPFACFCTDKEIIMEVVTQVRAVLCACVGSHDDQNSVRLHEKKCLSSSEKEKKQETSKTTWIVSCGFVRARDVVENPTFTHFFAALFPLSKIEHQSQIIEIYWFANWTDNSIGVKPLSMSNTLTRKIDNKAPDDKR